MSMFEQVRDVGSLTAAMAGGHRPSTRRGPGREVLSQRWKVRFEVDGVGYSSAEHWMMAATASGERR